ncbi:MAG: hypothetical protein GY884_04205, partial [Proteobacteria bacterium]|nr:hypothetical protein [Pseudomonadota bacterium]
MGHRVVISGLLLAPLPVAAQEVVAETDAEAVELFRQALEGTERLERVLSTVHSMARTSTSEALDDDERAYLHDRYLALADEHDQIVRRMRFDGQALAEGAHTLVGGGQTVELPDLRGTAVGVDTGSIDVSTATGAVSALSVLDEACEHVDRVGDEVRQALIELEGADFAFGADRRSADTDFAEEVLDRAGGATSDTEDLVVRIHQLAIASASEVLSDDERDQNVALVEALVGRVEHLAATTRYEGLALVDGSVTQLAVGLYGRLSITLGSLQTTVLGLDSESVDLSTATGAVSALSVVDHVLDTLGGYANDYRAERERIRLGRGPILLSATEPLTPFDPSLHLRGLGMLTEVRDAVTRVSHELSEVRRWTLLSGSESLDDDERSWIQDDWLDQAEQIDAIAVSTAWNGVQLTDGTNTALSLGAELPMVELPDLRTTALGVDTGTLDLSTSTGATSALSTLVGAMDELEEEANRLTVLIDHLETDLAREELEH